MAQRKKIEEKKEVVEVQETPAKAPVVEEIPNCSTISTLVKEISALHNITQDLTRSILRTAFSEMADSMAAGIPVRIADFGTFNLVHRAARMGHNPQTGEALEISPRTIIKFRPGRDLRLSVRDLPAPEEDVTEDDQAADAE